MPTNKSEMEFRAKPEGIILNGKRLNIRGCSWFGNETPDKVFHGLWQTSWKSLIDFLVNEKYNLVRIPLSIELIENLDMHIMPRTINYALNPDLLGKNCGQILDMFFEEFAKRGILILPDVHRNASSDGITELWYTEDYPETRLINAWVKLLKRYKNNPYVFAADIRNEPHGRATWGGPPETDWASACERVGNVILRDFPEKLIFVAGVEKRNKAKPWGSYWGSVLDSVKERPIKLNLPERVVYAVHWYGPSVFEQEYQKGPQFPSNLAEIMENDFGYICRQKLGCVFLGEIGGRAVDKDAIWHEAVTKYIEGNPGLLGNVAVWSLNANSGDTGGLLKDDWRTPEEHKLVYYRRMSPSPSDVKALEKKKPKPPVVTPTPVSSPQKYRVSVTEISPTRFQLDVLPK